MNLLVIILPLTFFFVEASNVDVSELLEKFDALSRRLDFIERENVQLKERLGVLEKEREVLTFNRNVTKWQTSMTEKVRRRELPDYQVAFHARLGADLTHIGKLQPIVFDHVVTNIGQAYEGRDGIFITPRQGVYVFYWNLMTDGHSAIDSHLMSTSGDLCDGYAGQGYNSFNNGGNMAVVHLNAGIHVWVRKADSYGNFLHERFTTFSGFLLFETY